MTQSFRDYFIDDYVRSWRRQWQAVHGVHLGPGSVLLGECEVDCTDTVITLHDPAARESFELARARFEALP